MINKKITAILGATTILLSAVTAPVFAGSLGIGISGKAAFVEIEGKETVKTNAEVHKAQHDTAAAIPSGYVQYTFWDNGAVLGYERIAGQADLVSKSRQTTQDVGSDTNTAANQIIKANLSDMDQFYIETPTLGGFFLKVGMDRGRIQTSETLGTGSAYGDKDLDGQTFGFGFRGTSDSGIHMKIIAEQTEFDDLEFKSTADAEGNQNTINTSDFNTYGLKFSIGYNF